LLASLGFYLKNDPVFCPSEQNALQEFFDTSKWKLSKVEAQDVVHSFSPLSQPKVESGSIVTAGVINFLMFVIATASHAAMIPISRSV
jgi:hypothetical protein